jgi:hypothetical protein
MMAARIVRLTLIEIEIGFIGLVELAFGVMCHVGRSLASAGTELPDNPCGDLCLDCRALLPLPVAGLPVLDLDPLGAGH